MNYYAARQLADGSGWHFTKKNGGQIWPVGDCASHGAHATREEAIECYGKWLLEHTLRLDLSTGDVHRPCVVCGVLTNRGASVDHDPPMHLCDEHRTREEVARRFDPPAEIASSW